MRAVRVALTVCTGALVAAAPFARTDASAAAGDAGAPVKVVRSHLNPYVDASVPLQLDPKLVTRTPPDPPATRERTQYIFDLRWDHGDLFLLGVHRVELPAPQETPRVMGRFALELFEGPTLVERVRFDFPLLGAGEPLDAGGMSAPPRFEAKLKTRIGVMFPALGRGNRLELWDRATDRRYPLAWPPVAAPPPDGG
jgi:hypothetical protein